VAAGVARIEQAELHTVRVTGVHRDVRTPVIPQGHAQRRR
jgi:hypothetical protein